LGDTRVHNEHEIKDLKEEIANFCAWMQNDAQKSAWFYSAESDLRQLVESTRWIRTTKRVIAWIVGAAIGTIMAWNAAVEQGRAAALAGETSGTAYVEFSADQVAPGFDVADPRIWAGCMPALGHTQSLAAVMQAYKSMSKRIPEFMRAFLNITYGLTQNAAIPEASWLRCAVAPGEDSPAAIVLAAGLTRDRGLGFIASAGYRLDSRIHVEIVACRPGIDWMAPRITQLQEKWGAGPVVLDRGGPESTLIPDLEKAPVPFRLVGTTEVCRASAAMLDDIVKGVLAHVAQKELDDAVGGSQRKDVGNMWLWDRQAAVDPAALVAATLARWGLVQPEEEGDPAPEPVKAQATGVY
jgi:hypothetical protein